jgi:hypothetical protein
MLCWGPTSVRMAPLVGRDAHEALLSTPISAPLQAPHFLKEKNPPSSPPPSPTTHPTLLRAPPHALIHFARCRRRGKGGLRLRPHPACPSVGRGGLRAAPRVYTGPLLLTSPEPELAGYRSSLPSRLWPPTMLCFECFKHFGLMFQVFLLNVAYVARPCFKCMFQVFHMFQTHVASVSSRCCKSRSRCCICCYDYTCMF